MARRTFGAAALLPALLLALSLALATVSLPLHAQTALPGAPPPLPVPAPVNAPVNTPLNTEDPYDPTMPSYSITSEDAANKLNQYCAAIYNPLDSLLTVEQAAFKREYQAALNAEVQKCVAQFSPAEVASHRRIAMRYCLGNNNYTAAGKGAGKSALMPALMLAYDQCMYKNDTLTAFCNVELRYRGALNHMPNLDQQICPAPRPNGREALVIVSGGHADMGHPVVIPRTGPGLPAVLLSPMDAGLLQLSLPTVARGPAPFPAPTPVAGAWAPAIASPAAPAPAPTPPTPAEQAAAQAQAVQEQRAAAQAANRQTAAAAKQRAVAAKACMQQAKNDHPDRNDLAAAQKQYLDCVQGVQSGPAK